MFNRLTDEKIAEAKRGHTAVIYKYGKPPDVWESDRAVAEAQCLSNEKQALEEMIEWTEKVFKDIAEMELIKNHHGHKKGEVKLVACARCTYEHWYSLKLQSLKDRLEEVKK